MEVVKGPDSIRDQWFLNWLKRIRMFCCAHAA